MFCTDTHMEDEPQYQVTCRNRRPVLRSDAAASAELEIPGCRRVSLAARYRRGSNQSYAGIHRRGRR